MNIFKAVADSLDDIGGQIEKKLESSAIEELESLKSKSGKDLGEEFTKKYWKNHSITNAASAGGVEGLIAGSASGAVIGGVMGGIDEDETFIEGAAKGALTGGLTGAAIGGISGGIHKRGKLIKNVTDDLMNAQSVIANAMAKNSQATT